MLLASAAASSEGLLSLSAGAGSAARRFARPVAARLSRTADCSRGFHRSPSAFAYPATAAAAAIFNSSDNSRKNSRRASAKPIPRATTTTMSSAATATSAAAAALGSTLDTLPFDNQVIRELPVDPIPDNYVRRVENACFSVVAPDPVVKPVMVAASDSALELLGLPAEEGQREDAAQYFSGEFDVDVDVLAGRVPGVRRAWPWLIAVPRGIEKSLEAFVAWHVRE